MNKQPRIHFNNAWYKANVKLPDPTDMIDANDLPSLQRRLNARLDVDLLDDEDAGTYLEEDLVNESHESYVPPKTNIGVMAQTSFLIMYLSKIGDMWIIAKRGEKKRHAIQNQVAVRLVVGKTEYGEVVRQGTALILGGLSSEDDVRNVLDGIENVIQKFAPRDAFKHIKLEEQGFTNYIAHVTYPFRIRLAEAMPLFDFDQWKLAENHASIHSRHMKLNIFVNKEEFTTTVNFKGKTKEAIEELAKLVHRYMIRLPTRLTKLGPVRDEEDPDKLWKDVVTILQAKFGPIQ